MNPDFPAMERFLGAPIPQQIVDMYRMDIIHNTDIELTNPNDPENPWTLSAFIPAHPADYDHMWDEARDKFCFAESPCGDPYYVDPKMSELPVYIYYHDGDDHEKVADSLSEFLSWIPRKAAG